MWPWQGCDAMMHMLVAPDGSEMELQPYGAPPVEQELELLRDNADDGLEGHVRYVGAAKCFFMLLCLWQSLAFSRRRSAGRWNGLASARWLLALEQRPCSCSTSEFIYFLEENLFLCFFYCRNGCG